MVVRKTYDHWGIEISTWNKSNIVTFIDCDCGQLAKRELGKYNQFKCDSCNKEYILPNLARKKRGLWVFHVCSTEPCRPCIYKH